MTKPQLERLMIEIHRIATGHSPHNSDYGRLSTIERLSKLDAVSTVEYARKLVERDEQVKS